MTNVKMEMKKKARTIRGLTTLLCDDADYICVDAEDFDLVGLGVSIHEVKDTLQRVLDNVMELEYMLYMVKKDT